ncbi:YhgE/Pip domain-containing protein [Streptomyces sp. NPDC005438]|uniref:YhgE/Pip domain-containing protein n=1 Tax=Streptomyces sp. NPDC005438 TaxID=3156880 RepID=UPI0033A8BE96
MRSPRLAGLELRRFARGRLPRAAMVAVLLLPLLYGALYLWSFWDPYGRLDRIPVALVNEDRGAKVDGDRLHAGDSLVERLHESDTFDWRETDARDARKGVESGRYYLSLTIPEDFSPGIASSSGDHPRTSALKVRTNDANNYVVGQISRTVFSEVRAAASAKASRGFLDQIFVSFSDLHDKTSEAADGSAKLGKGIGRAEKGADQLGDGLSTARKGSKKLKDGTVRLDDGAGQLEKGSRQLANGTGQLSTKVNKAAKEVRPFLKNHGQDIAKASRAVAKTSRELKKHLDDLPRAAHKAAKDARRAATTLDTLYQARCGKDQPPPETTRPSPPTSPSPSPSASEKPDDRLPAPGDCAQLKKAVDAAKSAARVAERVDDYVSEQRNLDRLGRQLDSVDKWATALAKRAPTLHQDLDRAVTRINRLDSGAKQVHQGARKLHTGLGTARSGATTLDKGVGRLSAGADTLHQGMYRLSDGSRQLTDGLRDGASRIPDYDADTRDQRTGVMADPVRLASHNSHAAPNYGTGFAPYFIPLSLWVGAMVGYMVLQPLNRRALAVGAPSWRVTLAGWLPMLGLGLAQGGALLAVLHWGLGLRAYDPVGTVGFLALVTCCFTALVQFLIARFGPAGRILVLALLMLQLTSAGGTYPVQTSPEFFNLLHPWLPMTHVVEGLRLLITGGDPGALWRACAVLAAYTLGALALTAVTARRRQVWTVDRLHPELTL